MKTPFLGAFMMKFQSDSLVRPRLPAGGTRLTPADGLLCVLCVFAVELKSAVYARVQYMHKRIFFVCLFLANPTLQSGLFGGKMAFRGFIPTC